MNWQEKGQATKAAEKKRSAAKITVAIQELQVAGVEVNVTSVARIAGVNRSTVYRHEALVKEITGLREQEQRRPPDTKHQPLHEASRYLDKKARYLTAHAQINTLTSERDAAIRSANQAMGSIGTTIDPSALANERRRSRELTVELQNRDSAIDSLKTQLSNLQQELEAAIHLNREYTAQLTATQEKHQETRRALTSLKARIARHQD